MVIKQIGRVAGLAALMVGLMSMTSLSAQMTPDQMAELILSSARKAYNEKQYPVAATRFKEFLAKFGNHKEVPVARYGLALTLLEGVPRDYNGALEQLNALAGVKDFADYPHVLYYLGSTHRGLGVGALDQANAKPQEAPQLRAQANQRFDEASKQFAAAAAAFAARVKAPDTKPVPAELDWSARALCDQAEMLLRQSKAKEAQAIAASFQKPPLANSRYRPLGLYYHGFACFLLGELNNAGRSLSMLEPFNDPIFGTHARYLLARVHHLSDERAEAGNHYQAVLNDHAKQKAQGIEALKQPQQLSPDDRARIEVLVKGPSPDHVARSTFYLGVLQYEAGRFADAQANFATFPKMYPDSPLLLDALLRQGFSQVQTKDFNGAIQALTVIVQKEPRLADQALLWIGKAQAGTGDPSKPEQYNQALGASLNTLKQAADRAQQMLSTDPDAKTRKGEILVELADTQQLLKQYKEAAATYDVVLNEKLLAPRDEELLLRRIVALQLAGDHPGCDQNVARFQQAFPKSPLMPAALFRFAENAYFQSLAAEKIPDVNARVKEVARLQDETAKRYQVVIDKFPEYPHVNLARYGMGMVLYRKGDFDKARAILEKIPQADRSGDLAATPYLVADCLIRLAPESADDALAAGKLQEQLTSATEMLDSFIGSDPKGPRTADALIKYGLCQQRLAGVFAQKESRDKALAAARAAYDRVMKEFPQDPLASQALFERSKVQHLAGDKNGAVQQLRQFAGGNLAQARVAPMAMIQLATYLRELNQAPEAVKVLAAARGQHEGNLAKDPERAGWVALLQYHHGVALRESGQFAEARGVFDQVVKGAAGRPEGLDATLRLGQCLQQEGLVKIEAARKRLATPNLKPEENAQASKELQDAYKMVQDSVVFFETQAEQLKQKAPTADARSRMHYEAAWGSRVLAGPEVAAARTKIQLEMVKKHQDEAIKKDPNYKAPANPLLPEVPLTQIPIQPSEAKARANYQALVAAFPEAPLSIDGRFELAELLAQRNEIDPALKLLSEALDKEPSQDMTNKIRIRRGAFLAAKKDYQGALAQFDAIAGNPKNPVPQLAQAHYRAGECLLELNDPGKAAARLVIFRDQGPFQGVPEVSDRAMLRLGHAYAALNQWDASRQAHEILLQRFPQSPYVHEARYGIGWAMQNQKQFDPAVAAYAQVIAGTATEIAAKAQLQTGLCRLEQKRHGDAAAAFLVVPFTYDYPELNAAALCEAARTYMEMKQNEQAEKLLERVIKDHGQSKWAEVAKERLAALKKGS